MGQDDAVPQAEVDYWVDAIARLWGSYGDATDAGIAGDATAMLWSGYGFQGAPYPVLEMMTRAIEIGYMAALEDIRRGALDREIQRWRPDLTSG
jgi:hypothetical protein